MNYDHIITTDGETYINVDDVREALGIVDEYVDIFGVIKKLKEERDELKEKCGGLKADLELTEKLYKENRDFVDKVCEAVDIQRPCLESGYDRTVKQIAGFKRERDELKDRLQTYRFIANGTYGDSCGKEPAFLCDVISYSWEFAPITPCSLMDEPTYRVRNDSIRVELNLTPTANYKGTFDLEDLKRYIQEYGREKKLGIGEASDIFDTPRYRFLSELSSELGFRTIVGPGNAEKTEQDILRIVRYRNDELKNLRSQQLDGAREAEARKEFLRKLRCELGVRYPVVDGCKEEMENDILERIGELKEGNWPCENGVTFAEFMRKQFPKECEKWNVVPLQEGSVHDWVQYIFGILDEWRKRAVKAEEELDRAWSHCGKLKGMLNTWYGASCGDNVLPCYRDTCNNPKAIREREAAKDALAELRAKIRDVCNEIFDCSNGDPEGSDKEALEDILEEYRRVVRNFETLKRQLDDEKKLVSKVRAERDSNKARRLVFLDKLANILDVSYSSGFIPAKEQDILRAVQTLSENYEATTRVLEEKRKEYDSLEALYKSSLKLLGEYVSDAKDILGIDSCEKDTVVSAIKALKSAYNSLRNDYDEVCEGYTKLKKDYDNLGEAYSSVLKWNNSYADVRRLLGISADADAGEMVGALNKLVCDYEKLKEAYEKAKCNTNYFVEFEKNCRERQAFIVKLCEALDIDTEDIGSFFDDEEAAILKAIEEHHEATASIDQLRQNWYTRYKSEHTRANGEHKRAEKLCSDITALKKQVEFLEESSNTRWNEVVALETFRNECRKLKDEKAKVIEALGQDIWDDCVK